MVLDNITAGKWGDQSSKLNNNFNKTNAEIIALQGIANGGGKLFVTIADLTAAYPKPVKGLYGYVSATLSFPAEIYSYNGTTWIDTGHTGNGGDAAENIDATLSTKIVQGVGKNTDKMMSQKSITDELSKDFISRSEILLPVETLENVLITTSTVGIFEATTQLNYKTSNYIELVQNREYLFTCNDAMSEHFDHFRLYDEDKNLLYNQQGETEIHYNIKIKCIGNIKYIKFVSGTNFPNFLYLIKNSEIIKLDNYAKIPDINYFYFSKDLEISPKFE